MNKPKIYIDGQAGTTGLQILERLKEREDLELILIAQADRKDLEKRKECFAKADLAFLCLPDQAAIEAVSLAEGTSTKIIDASTAHRTSWIYGFPELDPDQRKKIKEAKYVANPGCHATGFISIVHPLIQANLIKPDISIHAFSLTGYSGGGKSMIQQYEGDQENDLLKSPAIYGLSMQHKHIPEMQKISGLSRKPLFTPIVDDYYNGMLVSIQFELDARQVFEVLNKAYQDQPLIEVEFGNNSFLYANAMKNTDHLKLYVHGNEEQTIVCASFDNLGKGACGAAIQNMNIMLGFEETKGLR